MEKFCETGNRQAFFLCGLSVHFQAAMAQNWRLDSIIYTSFAVDCQIWTQIFSLLCCEASCKGQHTYGICLPFKTIACETQIVTPVPQVWVACPRLWYSGILGRH